MNYRGSVIVGITGRESDRVAITRGIAEARSRFAPLRLIYAYRLPNAYASPAGTQYGRACDDPVSRTSAERLTARVVGFTRDTAGDLDVQGEAVEGWLVDVLITYSFGTNVIVVAAAARRPVKMAVACPLIITRATVTERIGGDVVLACIASGREADAVLEFAFEQASRWALPLSIVASERVGRGGLETVQTVTRWAERYPDVRVDPLLLSRSMLADVVERAAAAHLLVVGQRSGLGLRSVSRSIQRKVGCAVALVPIRKPAVTP